MGPYSNTGNQWVSFDDVPTIRLQVNIVNKNCNFTRKPQKVIFLQMVAEMIPLEVNLVDYT